MGSNQSTIVHTLFRYRKDNIHVDDPDHTDMGKIMGILNNDWNSETDGGAFHHGGDLKPDVLLTDLMQHKIFLVITRDL